MSKRLDDFGDRMKAHERMFTDARIDSKKVMCVRIDGKRFSKFTRNCVKPFDTDLHEAMVKTTEYLVQETHAAIGYTQSDEITLLFLPKENELSTHIFDGKVSKVNSVLASMATAYFNYYVKPDVNVKFAGKGLALFDCRAWQVDDLVEASNVLLWRIQDCRKNSVASAYRWIANEKITPCQTVMKSILKNKFDYDWDTEEDRWKYGSFVKRFTYVKDDVLRSKVDSFTINQYYGDKSLEDRILMLTS